MVLKEFKAMLEKSTFDLASFQREFQSENTPEDLPQEKEIEKGKTRNERGKYGGSVSGNFITKEDR